MMNAPIIVNGITFNLGTIVVQKLEFEMSQDKVEESLKMSENLQNI